MFQCQTLCAAQTIYTVLSVACVVQSAQCFALEVLVWNILTLTVSLKNRDGTGNALHYCREELCLAGREADRVCSVLPWSQVLASYPTES